ncbi:hypothetical protein [Neptuniibacter marinus]|uniref:hypothetical protein n=1 Tax=Neptuniibacter marinus TaxID=1806670 RepID=UPI003B5ABCD5
MSKPYFLALLTSAILSSFSISCYANDEEKITKNLIKECKSKASIEWDSGITSRMKKGNYIYYDCLVDKIRITLEDVMWDENQINETVKNLEDGVYKIVAAQYELENNHKPCGPNCGTMYLVTPYAAGFLVLERFLADAQNISENK